MTTPKGPSLRKVARTYRKTHSKPAVEHEGARFFNGGANPYALGKTTSKVTYTPAAKSITLGGTRKNKPATIRKRGTSY